MKEEEADILHQRSRHARELEKAAKREVREMEIQTEAMLEEQRRGTIREESKAAGAAQSFGATTTTSVHGVVESILRLRSFMPWSAPPARRVTRS